MHINHTLDKAFGPTGSFAGLILVIVGVILIPFFWAGAILIIIGAFTGFTASGCEINTETRQVRQYHLLFGLFKTGKWQRLEGFSGLRVVQTRNSYRAYSLSNRSIVTTTQDFRVVLEAGTPQSRVEIQKCSTREDADEEARKLSETLGMEFLDN
ncbi:MAG: hypothetical protein ISR57_02705 [Bacteroidales bacterium]|nr:hypothetical protein [Bacteroidota bacterium]MBL6949531.1 hypothetical protein [Bacteroidales bacterium]